METTTTGGNLSCSFCGKSQKEVKKLIAGPDGLHLRRVYRALQRHHRGGGSREGGAYDGLAPIREAVRDQAALDDYVIGQDAREEDPRGRRPQPLQAHRSRVSADDVELQKSNILLLGPTGLWKTLPRPDARPHPPRPFAIADATTLTEAGLRRRGRRTSSFSSCRTPTTTSRARAARHRLHRRDRQDRRKATTQHHPRRLGRGRAAGALLKIIEGTIANVRRRADASTRSTGLPAGRHDQHPLHLRRRLRRPRSDRPAPHGSADPRLRREIKVEEGLPSSVSSSRASSQKTSSSLVSSPSSSAAFPSSHAARAERRRADRHPHQAEERLVKQFQKIFEMDGVKLKFSKSALSAVAREALARNAGARGLRAILEGALLDIMYDVPPARGSRKS